MSMIMETPFGDFDPFRITKPEHGRVWAAAAREPFGHGTYSGTTYAEACGHYATVLSYQRLHNPSEDVQAAVIRHMVVMDTKARTLTSAYRIAAGEDDFNSAVVGISEELGDALTRNGALALTVADLFSDNEAAFGETLDRACWLAHQTQTTFRDLSGRWGTLTYGVPNRLNIERYLPAHAAAALDGLGKGYRDAGGSVYFMDELDSLGWA